MTALTFVLVWYLILHGITTWIFHAAPAPTALVRDLIANLILGAILFSITRSSGWFMPTIAALMAALHLSNAGKLVVLGGPIMPDDFASVINLFLLFEGWKLAGIAAIILIPTLLFILMTAWLSWRTWLIFSVIALSIVLIILKPVPVVHAMDRQFGNIVWNQRGNYEHRGLLIHLLQESVRQLGREVVSPTKRDVTQALDTLMLFSTGQKSTATETPVKKRNLHLILLESFWDASLLKKAGFSSDPVDPEFRQLWAQTDDAHALSPVMGGYTANAEFEVLCGFPVTHDAVFFEGWLKNDAPCLPRVLRQLGYRTIASHPNIAAFWNRVNAYKRVGFDTYWSINDFVLDDMNDNFLSDESMYRQVFEKTQLLRSDQRPVFNYVLTYSGHLPYPLNDRRPKIITSTESNLMVQDYANTIYYKSRELMAHLKKLRARDPDALIVLFGDHLPFLGPNFSGFIASGLLANNRSKFDDKMLGFFVRTPLVVIDGQRGPLKTGDMPLYSLPSLILRLLKEQEPAMLQMTQQPADILVRPLPGMHFSEHQGKRQVCRGMDSDPAACAKTTAWLQAVITLSDDIFSGDQYALRSDNPPSIGAANTALK